MFTMLESYMSLNGTVVSSFTEMVSAIDLGSPLLQFSILAAGVGLIRRGLNNQQEEGGINLENEKNTAPFLLDLWTDKNVILSAINKYEQSYNQLLEQQLEVITGEIDMDCCSKLADEKKALYIKLAKINEQIESELGEIASFSIQTINDIREKMEFAKELSNINDELRLKAADIELLQQTKLNEKDILIEQMRKQLACGNDAITFFSKRNESESTTTVSSKTWGLK